MDRSQHSEAAYRMYLIGPFAITDPEGKVLTPKSQKSQAILAMLAVSLRGSRSRVWLRDKLWSDRPEDQASASLRQALLDIRKCLGDARDILVADKNTVSLRMDRIRLDIDEILSEGHPAGNDELAAEHFLEGVDVRDAEFEEWLTLERQVWQRRYDEGQFQQKFEPKLELARQNQEPTPLVPLTAINPGTNSGGTGNGAANDKASDSSSSVSSRQWVVAILPSRIAGQSENGQILAAGVTNLIAKSLVEGTDIRVTDFSFGAGPGANSSNDVGPGNEISLATALGIQLELTLASQTALIVVSIVRLADHSLIWKDSCIADRPPLERGETSQLHGLINHLIDEVNGSFLFRGEGGKLERETTMIEAVNSVFRLSRGDLDRAERILHNIAAERPSSSVYAWLAFIRTFRVGQRFNAYDSTIVEEAQFYARKALELDANNSIALALVGHVHSFLFCEYDYAAGLFERAIKLNPAQPLGWDLYSMLHCYAGQPEKALAMANWVQNLGFYSVHKYYFDTTKCISAALAGDHAAAISAGEDALKMRPDFNSLLRYMAASHAHRDEMALAEKYVERLEAVEPNFSIESLKDNRYPLLKTGGGKMLIAGLTKAGVKRR
ncbi:SARP family transcriptional regulator [Phyllobacterium chamaecytisi]|uniref:SARP family transcriptional regulator n=1 Tax=Phyllobacterium chamaecytisi TaxID=2876082 RepID=UPI001CCB293D|nr:SARP family transcriptional regulator [Phyllobacterium sp. KW56]MBZ9603428.1 SARP family transcriptional regulator [Phyllobacterium sp. KW56]